MLKKYVIYIYIYICDPRTFGYWMMTLFLAGVSTFRNCRCLCWCCFGSGHHASRYSEDPNARPWCDNVGTWSYDHYGTMTNLSHWQGNMRGQEWVRNHAVDLTWSDLRVASELEFLLTATEIHTRCLSIHIQMCTCIFKCVYIQYICMFVVPMGLRCGFLEISAFQTVTDPPYSSWVPLSPVPGEEAKKLYKSTVDCAMQIMKNEGWPLRNDGRWLWNPKPFGWMNQNLDREAGSWLPHEFWVVVSKNVLTRTWGRWTHFDSKIFLVGLVQPPTRIIGANLNVACGPRFWLIGWFQLCRKKSCGLWVKEIT